MGVGAVCALALVWSQIESARGNRMDGKPMRFDQYEHQYTGGPADERAIPEEPSGSPDVRPIGEPYYDGYGYGG